MKIENRDDEMMVIAAIEYCLGRKSYIVTTCCEWTRRILPQLSDWAKTIILRNIVETLASKLVPNRSDWVGIGRFMVMNMSEEEIREVERMVHWKGISDIRQFLFKDMQS